MLIVFITIDMMVVGKNDIYQDNTYFNLMSFHLASYASNYLAMIICFADFFAIVTLIGRTSLFCSTPNLLTSFFRVTSYCVITGE